LGVLARMVGPGCRLVLVRTWLPIRGGRLGGVGPLPLLLLAPVPGGLIPGRGKSIRGRRLRRIGLACPYRRLCLLPWRLFGLTALLLTERIETNLTRADEGN